MDAVLRSMHALTVLLVEEVLHMEDGYASSCTAVQKTTGVFFPLHTVSARAWWHLVHVSFPSWRRASVMDAHIIPRTSSATPMEVKEVACFLCFLWPADADRSGDDPTLQSVTP